MSQRGEKRTIKTQKTLFEAFEKKPHESVSREPVDNAENDSSISVASNNVSSSSSVDDLETNSYLLVSTVPSHSAPNDPHTVPHLVDSLSQSNALKLPRPSTLEKWKKKHEWLVITERNTMISIICISQKEKILLKNPSSQMAFITGTTNFKASALKRSHVARMSCYRYFRN